MFMYYQRILPEFENWYSDGTIIQIIIQIGKWFLITILIFLIQKMITI